MSHKKFGPDRFSRFDVYWIQTNKQTDRQTDKPNLYIDDDNDKDKNVFFSFLSYLERHSSDAVLQLCVTINFYMTDFLRTHIIFNIIST